MMIQTDYYSFPPKPFNTPQNHGLVRDSHIFGTMESGGVKKKDDGIYDDIKNPHPIIGLTYPLEFNSYGKSLCLIDRSS